MRARLRIPVDVNVLTATSIWHFTETSISCPTRLRATVGDGSPLGCRGTALDVSRLFLISVMLRLNCASGVFVMSRNSGDAAWFLHKFFCS